MPLLCRKANPGSLDVTSWGQGKVTALGVATVVPIAYMLIFIGSIGLMTSTGIFPEGDTGVSFLFCVHASVMLLSYALMAIYIIIAIRSPIPANAKVLWAAASFFASMIAFPLAFYFLVWQPRTRAGSDSSQQNASQSGQTDSD